MYHSLTVSGVFLTYHKKEKVFYVAIFNRALKMQRDGNNVINQTQNFFPNWNL